MADSEYVDESLRVFLVYGFRPLPSPLAALFARCRVASLALTDDDEEDDDDDAWSLADPMET
jgi:hypothetical protein